MPVSSKLWGVAGTQRDAAVLFAVALVVAVVVVSYFETFASMFELWGSSDYAHGSLVVLVSAYLLWRLRFELAAVPLEPNVWGLGLVLALVLLWAVSSAVGVQVTQHLAVVLLIPAVAFTVFGPALVRSALFPLLLLVGAVPLGDALLPYLMEVTAELAGFLLAAAGVPVFRQGQFFSLPGGEFEVAEVCSGLRYLSVGVLLALLFGYLAYGSYGKRLALLLVMVAAMVLTNGIRAFVVMFVASASDMRYLAGRDHVYFGWLLFALVVALLIYAAGRFADRDESATRPASAPHAVGAVYGRAASIATLAVTTALLAGVPALLAARETGSAPAVGQIELPTIAGCPRGGAWGADWHPELTAPDALLTGRYDCSAHPVDVLAAVYVNNRQGHELVGEANRPIPDDLRRFVRVGEHHFTVPDGSRIGVNEARVERAPQEGLVWYWYFVGGDPAVTPAGVKLKQAKQVLLHGRADGMVLLLYTTLDSLEAARERLAAVAGAIAPLGDRLAGSERT